MIRCIFKAPAWKKKSSGTKPLRQIDIISYNCWIWRISFVVETVETSEMGFLVIGFAARAKVISAGEVVSPLIIN